MTELRACTDCRRHYRQGEEVCPFCGVSASPSAPKAPRVVSALTRAALFAGATLLVPACGSAQKKADNNNDNVQQGDGGGAVKKKTDGDGDNQGDDDDDKDAREKELEELDEREWRRGGDCTPDGVCPPYGAPPSLDDRLV